MPFAFHRRRHSSQWVVRAAGLLLAVVCAAGMAAPAPAQTLGPFGIFRNKAASPDTQNMQYLGVQWSTRLLRPLEPSWWVDADNTLSLQCSAGVQQIFTLSTAPDTTLDAHFPTDLPAWADSVNRVVERYDGDGFMDMAGLACPTHYWHIEAEDTFWKDSIDEYLTYLAITRAAILAADPSAKIITMGLSSSQTWNAAWYAGTVDLFPPTQGIPYDQLQGWMIRTQRLINEGAYDIIDIHCYETHNVLAGKMAWLRSIMPPDKEVWALESGAPFWSRRQGYTDTLNSQATVELYAEALCNGVKAVACGYLTPSPGNYDYTDQFINVALTRWTTYPNLQTKPAYEAYSQLTEKLGGFTAAVDMSDRTGSDETKYLYDMRFTTPRGVVDIVWSPSSSRSITLPIAGSRAKITYLIERAGQTKSQAQVSYVTVTNGFATITVTSDPVFIEADAPLAAGADGPGSVVGLAPLRLTSSREGSSVDFALRGAEGQVLLEVFDVTGARRAALTETAATDGTLHVTWDLAGRDGAPTAPGVYFVAATDARARRVHSRVLVLR